MGFKKNLSPEYRETHYRNLMRMFTREVYIVTEWRDGCVWKTKQVGMVVSDMTHMPLKPQSHAVMVVQTSR